MSASSSFRVAMLAALCTLAAGAATAADETIGSGTRVRIIRKGGQPHVVGRLVQRSPERLTVQTDEGRGIGVLFDQVARVQVSEGRDRKRGAGVGVLVGLVAAGAVYVSTDSDCTGGRCARRFGLMAAPAMVAGALVGSRVAPERWRNVDRVPDVASVDLSRRLRVGLAATPGGGARLTAAFAF